jgi:hypothetical protein
MGSDDRLGDMGGGELRKGNPLTLDLSPQGERTGNMGIDSDF